jgi:hypothetical protein
MKQIFTIICLSLFSFSLFSQTEFMPIGFRLTSNVGEFFGAAKETIISEKDTIIKDKQLRKLWHKYSDTQGSYVNANNFATYITQLGDSIFNYNQSKDVLEFLFKNKYKLGDSLFINCSSNNPKAVVDSIFQANGTTRYVIKTNYFSMIKYFNIYDAFGPTIYWNLSYQCSTDPPIFTPICYRFNSKSTPYVVANRFNSSYNCELIMSSDEKWASELNINPNPSASFFQIDWAQENALSKIELINVQGQMLKSYPISTENSLRLDVQTIPNGIYFLQFKNNENHSVVKKVVVQH